MYNQEEIPKMNAKIVLSNVLKKLSSIKTFHYRIFFISNQVDSIEMIDKSSTENICHRIILKNVKTARYFDRLPYVGIPQFQNGRIKRIKATPTKFTSGN